MSRQPAPKTSRQVKPQPNKEQELYEHVEMQEQQSHYMTINRPNRVEVEDKSQLAGQISTKVKRGKRVVIALIAVFLVIALVVSLVAVIIYSPLVSSGDNTESSASTAGDNLLSRIQQLEGRMEQQGTNHSFELLQKFLEAQVQRQTDYNYILSRISQLEGRMQAIQGLNVTVANTVKSSALYSSQIASMQNLIQTSTLIQNNLRQDLDRLRTINLYEGCIQQTRTCTMPTSSTSTYATCRTSPSMSINPEDTQYFTSSILCNLQFYTGHFTSSTYDKSGNNIYCTCQVTYPNSDGHRTFSPSNGICTLTVTKCPYTRNLLN